MKPVKIMVGCVVGLFFLAALLPDSDGAPSTGYRDGTPDYYGIMDRLVATAEAFADEAPSAPTYDETGQRIPAVAGDALMRRFADAFEASINQRPALYGAPMGVSLLDDGSFRGFEDTDGDGEKGMVEENLWTLEIDAENERLVMTAHGGQAYGYSGLGSGFVTGAILGNMMSRQRTTGVNPSRFANARMATRSATTTRTRTARSSARTGGARVGK